MANAHDPGKTPQNPVKGPTPATQPGKGGGTGTGPGTRPGRGKGVATPKGDDRPPQISNGGVR
jgi:hypothetical protein